ncbi:MAG: trypsin-like peptidase domain-containing protein [Planctomycetaceae bacterium]|nr:trypsin-like peptidase domain-containing protein [Planctomycetaceae bacterium]
MPQVTTSRSASRQRTFWECWTVWLLVAAVSLAASAFVATPLPMNAGAQDFDGVLLDFTATWCGPCQQMTPIVEGLAREGFPIQKVDIDQQKALARQYNVASIPTFVLVVNGQEVTRTTGSTSEQQLRRMLLQIPAANRAGSPRPTTTTSGVKPLPRSPRSTADEFEIVLGEAAQFPGPSRPGLEAGAPANSLPANNQVAESAPPRSGIRLPNLFGGRPEQPARQPAPAPATVRGQSQEVDPLLATVRLRVQDPNGMNYGTGTILESRPGRTIVLTCGHVFRHLPTGQTFDVDVFLTDRTTRSCQGTVIEFDLEGDVGLLALETDQQFPAARLASPATPLNKGEFLQSIGCSGGADPTRENVQVTGINKYQGPDNIECSGVPQQGRSGGGLFRRNGDLVGVCILAEPQQRVGVYAAMTPIVELLHKANLGHLAPTKGQQSEAALAESEPGVPFADTAAGDVFASTGPVRPAVYEMTEPEANSLLGSGLSTDPSSLSRVVGGSAPEVICIVRTAAGPSRVVVLNQASEKFLGYLLNEVDGKSGRPAEEELAGMPTRP